MLSQKEHPVAWAMLMNELVDAHEHLGTLLAKMHANGGVEEAAFAVNLGHVFAHLNRAWHGRYDPHLDTLPEEQFVERS
ncbi:MAG: hypothetical protein ACRC7O_02905, partial [Fimbriiglobus sp.]